MWNLLKCYNRVKNLLSAHTPSTFNEKQKDILLNKIVFGNYGPNYNFQAGMYLGGYNWNTESNENDSVIDSEEYVPKVINWIIEELQLETEIQNLRRRYSGEEVYQQLASRTPPNTPPSQAASGTPPNTPPSQSASAEPGGGGSRVRQNLVIGRHCLGTYLSPFGIKEYNEFKNFTNIQPMTDGGGKHSTIFLILFFENNLPVSYHSNPYSSTSQVENICNKWIERGIPPTTNNKLLDSGQVKNFISLNNLDSNKMPFIDGGSEDRYWVVSGDAKLAQGIAIKK